jgi:hypothetical protein
MVSSPPQKYQCNLAQEAINKAAEEGAVAHSPMYAGDYSGEVLMGKVPQNPKKEGKKKTSIQHELPLRGMQRYTGVQHIFVPHH